MYEGFCFTGGWAKFQKGDVEKRWVSNMKEDQTPSAHFVVGNLEMTKFPND